MFLYYDVSMPNFVDVTYEQTGKSLNVDSLGMREMQKRAFEQKNAKYLLIKPPPASGKSRALMFIGLDKLYNQGIKKVKVIPDGSGKLTKEMNMLVAKDDVGFGMRSWRYAALINDSEVEKIWEEDNYINQVAKINRSQIEKLKKVGITTVEQLAKANPDKIKVKINKQALKDRISQAQLQEEKRETGKSKYIILIFKKE